MALTISFFNRLICYSMVGVSGTAAHWILFFVMINYVKAGVVVASSAGFVLGAVINYYLNYCLTFKSKKAHSKAALRFLFCSFILFLINMLSVHILVSFFHFHPYVSQFISSGIILFTGYCINKLWTF